MKRDSIEFVAHQSVTEMVLMLDAYKFRPAGRWQWLQHMAWRFLMWRKALAEAYEPKVTITRHRIDAEKFMEMLYKQRSNLFEHFHKEGRTLLIGSEDYADLMCSPEMTPAHFSFDAEARYGRNILGLKVEVIPWMRGAVVMP